MPVIALVLKSNDMDSSSVSLEWHSLGFQNVQLLPKAQRLPCPPVETGSKCAAQLCPGKLDMTAMSLRKARFAMLLSLAISHKSTIVGCRRHSPHGYSLQKVGRYSAS